MHISRLQGEMTNVSVCVSRALLFHHTLIKLWDHACVSPDASSLQTSCSFPPALLSQAPCSDQ